MPEIRRGTPADLGVLLRIEEEAFEPGRRASRASLVRSLRSTRQSVWLMGDDAAMVLWHHPHALRIYGIAVRPGAQGRGLGVALLEHALVVARRQGARRIMLEAAADRPRLLAWYEQHGYRRERMRPDFYGPDRAAVRLTRRL